MDTMAKTEETYIKPPLGIIPRFIFLEERLINLERVIAAYMNAKCIVNPEWIEEYNYILDFLKRRNCK
jgi:hypothetical protein